MIDEAETSESISFTDENQLLDMRSMASQVGRQLNLHCNSVSLPGHDLQAQDMQHGSAPGRQMVTSHDYQGTIAATFYLDSHLRERHFFEKWQKMAVNTNTNQIATQAVQFQYRQWFNLTADTIAGYKGANLFDLELKRYGI